MFNVSAASQKMSTELGAAAQREVRSQQWIETLFEEARAKYASQATKQAIEGSTLEAFVREIFENVNKRALDADGITLADDLVLSVMGDLSGLGPLMTILADDEVEDIAITLGVVYIYKTFSGWEYYDRAAANIFSALRVLIDRAHQHAPTPDYPISDAMLTQMVPGRDGILRRKGLRINFIAPPVSPYGEIVTIRISNFRERLDSQQANLALLCESRLPPVPRRAFKPIDFPRGEGALSPEAANYLLSVMVRGGTMIIAGATGSGKTYIATRVLQEMLNFFRPGEIRLFIIEDSNEIVLNGWDGNAQTDTQNIIYTVTRPEIPDGPRPVTMYDLIRAALRSRPHGLIIGEARGAEAWEFVRATATGHGHSIFTIHATSAEHVWSRFMQVIQAHPDIKDVNEFKIAEQFAQAISTIVYIERNSAQGQVIKEIVEVQSVVEQIAARPAMLPLFRFDPKLNKLLPTGNRPNRPGFRCEDLGIPRDYFKV
jgi:Flp pilus assembly CpaF family ATPase